MKSMNRQFLSSGELAKRAGISTDTLHHYERLGVLTEVERAGNGYRQYPVESVARVAAIRQALDLGFTLQELGRFFAARMSGKPPCRQVRALASEKLEAVRAQMAALRKLEEELERIIGDWDERLSAADPEGVPARLLDSLGEATALPLTRQQPNRGLKRRNR